MGLYVDTPSTFLILLRTFVREEIAVINTLRNGTRWIGTRSFPLFEYLLRKEGRLRESSRRRERTGARAVKF